MEGKQEVESENRQLVSRLFARLRAEAPDYEWDSSVPPFHSSYDNWHVHGLKGSSPRDSPLASNAAPTERSSHSARHRQSGGEQSREEENAVEPKGSRVVARISRHLLRLEREYKLAQKLYADAGHDNRHFVRPLRFLRLRARQASDVTLVVSIFESPGQNYLQELVEFGPNFYPALTAASGDSSDLSLDQSHGKSRQKTSLRSFMNFAIGAAECCERLHHGSEIVHGELRGDAFHYNKDTGNVRLINFGSGARSFENGLTSAGWSSLTSQVGIKHKLQFIAPEQTGRLPAEPDCRTDIYSLGILFWTMLADEPAFAGSTPLDIMQNVLSRKIPPIISKRPDLPALLSRIIQKMTQKSMSDRYQSSSGLLHDLRECRRLLSDGDSRALDAYDLGKTDVSSSFNLPNRLIGRQTQLQTIVGVIDRAAWRSSQGSPLSKKDLFSLASSSTFSGDRPDSALLDEIMSEDTSSTDRDKDSRILSVSEASPHDFQKRQSTNNSQDTTRSDTIRSDTIRSGEGALAPKLSGESRTSTASYEPTSRSASFMHSSLSGSLLRTARKLKKTGKCEVVSISGTAGLGKSSLLQTVQVHARSHGYYASSKFDQVKKAPFEPVFRVMSSLFRQIFSESDVATPFHNNVRQLVGPVWSSMHSALELPPWLLSQNLQEAGPQGSPVAAESTIGPTARYGEKGNTASDWLRSGGGNRDRRFVSTFLDVLRLLALQKFLCLCLDDLQFADEESLELIHSVVHSGISIVLILTSRSENLLPSKVQALLDNATKVQLVPFTEDQTAEYVAATLHRSPQYVVPLAAAVQEKTGGSPFFIREMLDACYRKKCIFYSWKSSQWDFDLNKVLDNFASSSTGEFSSNDYIARRLDDLAPNAKALLCWASLLGHSFSYSLIRYVMSCECSKSSPAEYLPPRCDDPVAGLQAAIAAFTIIGTDDEDRFRFSHDRYMQAAHALSGAYSREEMHYVISCAMMKHDTYDVTKPTKILFDQSRHVSSAMNVIKRRAKSRRPFRQLLYQASETARDQGARSISLAFLENSVALLPENPWGKKNDREDEEQYQETLALLTRTASAYWYLGQSDEAKKLTEDILEHAKEPADRSAAYVIESRIYAQQGDSRAAFDSMKRALSDLGHDYEESSWEACDEEFQRLSPLIQAKEPDLTTVKYEDLDRNLLTVGAVMIELLSGAFWYDALLFYQLTIKIMSIYLECGIFPQIAVGYIHMATIAIYRFEMLDFGIELGHTAKKLMAYFDLEAYTNGRGLTLHALFIGHLEAPIKEQLPILEDALDATVAAGDKILHLLNLGVTATYRLWASHELPDVELYITELHEQFPQWQKDLRGGALLISVRQYVRALQGKTNYKTAAHIFDDDEHQSQSYHDCVVNTASTPVRPLAIYDSYKLVALFRFGHVKEALELGDRLMPSLPGLWCMRFIYFVMFYMALGHIARIREEPDSPKRQLWLDIALEYRKKVVHINRGSDSVHSAWVSLLDAELADLNRDYDAAIAAYEAAITQTMLLGSILEEALSYELYADFLIRRGSSRPARGLILDAVAAYQRIGALGKAEQMTEKHAFVLHGTRSLASVDATTQTIDVSTGTTTYKLSKNEDDMASQTSRDRTQAWLTPNMPNIQAPRESETTHTGGLSAVGLDMIDLASILESSQLLSSELQVDKLLSKLTKIILDSTGAEICGLIVNDDDLGWHIASVSGSDPSLENYIGQPVDSIEDSIAKQVCLYILRFRESLFLSNCLEDERFAAPAEWRMANAEGKALIALPILHGDNALLGCIYIEGPPRSFTERNTAVLRLLVNQIAISIANALLFKKLDKVSASNAAMLEMQKQALDQAREAERKAKMAEAQAMEMVRLKEEAAKVKSMFLANVSHELRTPLNGVIGMSELLKASKLDSEQEGYADSIRVCADTLLSVINDILDFSKLEAGKMQMFNVQLSLTETISEVVRALSYTNMERGLQTVEQLELDKNLLVMGDPVRLHQILMNLLSNAYKFTAKGTVTVRCVVEHEDETTIQVMCSVTDTGIGISEEQGKKLFLPFSQADSSTARSYGGTGLGLSICKAIIEIMKGKVWLTSQIGVGTTVAFSLPFQKVKAGQKATERHAGGAADPMAIFTPSSEEEATGNHPYTSLTNVPRDQLRICIAEDNPINQKIAISFVQKLGFKCEAFGDGQQAVDALIRASKEGNAFHLVLMDVQMPVLDGYHATREIRKNPDRTVREVLVIAMTASAIRGDREKCLEAGMNNYLAKPVRAQVLKQMLEGYLSQTPKVIPDLQQQANQMAKEVIDKAETEGNGDVTPRSPERRKTDGVNGDGAKAGISNMPTRTRRLSRQETAKHVTSTE